MALNVNFSHQKFPNISLYLNIIILSGNALRAFCFLKTPYNLCPCKVIFIILSYSNLENFGSFSTLPLPIITYIGNNKLCLLNIQLKIIQCRCNRFIIYFPKIYFSVC